MVIPGEFVSGGAILIILGALLAYFKNIPGKIYRLIERFCFVRLEFEEEDESFHWIRLWLAKRLEGTLAVSVLTKTASAYIDDEDKKPDKPAIIFTPAPGTYWFRYQGIFCQMTRNRNEDSKSGIAGEQPLKPRESFIIRMLTKNVNIGRKLVEEARDYSLPDDGKVEIRTASHGYWKVTSRVHRRPLESIILDGNMLENILQDIKVFRESAEWYIDKGVPYRRGYLFYGPPGNGKSTLVLAIASALKMNINILNLSTPNMSDVGLVELMSSVSSNTIVLIEDIDCAFSQREEGIDRKRKIDSGLTFSGLLNAMDGITASQDGRIVCMTTNHQEKLDAAILRHGRIDIKLKIDNATRNQAARIFRRFYPDAPIEMSEKFADKIPEKKLNVASLQHHLIIYRNSSEMALNYEIGGGK